MLAQRDVTEIFTMTPQGGITMKPVRPSARALMLLLSLSALSGCGYNDLQGLDEDTKAAWSEVVNQYQRRADLIPNLVNTVKGYAAHERETLESVVKARAQATSVQITPERLGCPDTFPIAVGTNWRYRAVAAVIISRDHTLTLWRAPGMGSGNDQRPCAPDAL